MVRFCLFMAVAFTSLIEAKAACDAAYDAVTERAVDFALIQVACDIDFYALQEVMEDEQEDFDNY